MGIYLNPDNSDFQRAMNSRIYVDKSELIAFTNSVLMTEQEYISVSRPRRFGKSMAANMLTAYYSRGCDSETMFRHLKIAGAADFKKHLNQYNVIRLEMQSFLTDAEDMDDMLRMIQKTVLFDLTSEFPDVKYFDDTKLIRSLKDVFAKYRVPFIFIIDEWDCIFRTHKNDEEAQKKYLDFLRNLLKDQSYVALAYMTGILPIKKYGKHSALNMFYEYSILNAKPIEEFTGFTQEEVKSLCGQYHVSYDEMKKWYDGYTVNGVSVYNPKSVVESIMRGVFSNYWTQTETYEALKPYIQMNQDGLRAKVERLIAGEKIPVNTMKYQNDMTTFESADDVLTLLIHLGYLTTEQRAEGDCDETASSGDCSFPVEDLSSVNCSIPNSEVRQEFINCIEDGGWENVMDAIRNSEELLRLTIAGDEEKVAQRIAKVHMDNASVLQYNDETSLSCAISLAYYSAKRNYTIVREMPAGKGFADLVFVPDRNCSTPAMIVELKWNKSVTTALDQIRRQNYTACLERYTGELLLVGVNYDKNSKEHTCKIEKIKK
ncbi:MAG: ATP-binding protein [Lachnospiraceae bacterium]|nr:ATP-binding protein [Lachnospiraceae bacterium]